MLQNIVCKSAHALFTWVETFAAGGGGTENKGPGGMEHCPSYFTLCRISLFPGKDGKRR